MVSLHSQAVIVWTAGVATRERMGQKQKEKRTQQLNGSWLESAEGGWVVEASLRWLNAGI